ncbi:adenine nucleotide alpha hydrolase family protein [Aurantimonas coralicida]|uniref:Nin-like protein n=1 Tax=Aurantimonas coralicida TaxID=182270 RepID=UPI001D1872CF|nr:Nin-like protein [Aurantimonas coralicida]MCC4296273.1 Nin-like protein [Aurantimonas coralicida]
MADPYRIEGPALISFSGGRTSAFMLWNIIQAHGGTLPDDVVVAFANTGKERDETLRFVHECGSRWGVDIHWLEWRDSAEGFERVGFNSASRNGEPFAQIIAKKQRLPNWKERWCTEFLKVRPLFALAALQGWEAGSYAEVIGLRYDEGHRVLKGLGKADEKGRMVRYPLAKAKVVKADVMAFWAAQDFDLGLEPWEGNCDLCFLKGRAIKKQIIRNDPSVAAWWDEQETVERGNGRGFFDKRDRVAGLVAEVAASPTLFEDLDPEEYDVECGLTCSEAA